MYDEYVSASYDAVMGRRDDILYGALGIDYRTVERDGAGFDHGALMELVGLDLDEIRQVQRNSGVGGTPMIELHNLSLIHISEPTRPY